MGILDARIAKIHAGIAAKKVYAETKTLNHIKKTCANLLYDAALASPQWSGDYASNWNIVTGSFASYNGQLKVIPWQALRGNEKSRGDDIAVDIAVDRGMSAIDSIKLDSKIRLVNPAPVAADLEAQKIQIRPVNKLDPDVSVVSYLKMRYRCLP